MSSNSVWLLLGVLCLWCAVLQSSVLQAEAGRYSKEGEETTEEEEMNLFSELKSSPQHFLRLYKRYEAICKGGYNYVPARADGFSKEDPDRFYPWSLHSGTLHHYLHLPFTHPNHRNNMTHHVNPAVLTPMPFCKTTSDIAEMIADASIHLRPKCRLAWFSPPTICKLFHKFSLVQFNGDSLMRHTTQGFFMLFKEDWRYGAFPPNQKSAVYDQCSCDGEFSESELCRSWWLFLHGDQTHTSIDFRQMGLCPYFDSNTYSPSVNRSMFTYQHEVYGFSSKDVTCKEVNEKPAFFYLNAAAHLATNGDRVIREYLTPVLGQIQGHFQGCMDNVHIVYSGAIVCAEIVEKDYPHQSKALAKDFNVKVSAWLRENHPKVVYYDPWNITREATRRTSDGFHALTDTNLLHATAVMNLMQAFISK